MTLMVNTISCPALCVFAPLREALPCPALPGLYQQSLTWEGESASLMSVMGNE
jgi:hypothetical protein